MLSNLGEGKKKKRLRTEGKEISADATKTYLLMLILSSHAPPSSVSSSSSQIRPQKSIVSGGRRLLVVCSHSGGHNSGHKLFLNSRLSLSASELPPGEICAVPFCWSLFFLPLFPISINTEEHPPCSSDVKWLLALRIIALYFLLC